MCVTTFPEVPFLGLCEGKKRGEEWVERKEPHEQRGDLTRAFGRRSCGAEEGTLTQHLGPCPHSATHQSGGPSTSLGLSFLFCLTFSAFLTELTIHLRVPSGP